MDFFETNFSELFSNKHGKEIFDGIVKQITKEKSSECSDEYIEKINKIVNDKFYISDKVLTMNYFKYKYQ